GNRLPARAAGRRDGHRSGALGVGLPSRTGLGKLISFCLFRVVSAGHRPSVVVLSSLAGRVAAPPAAARLAAKRRGARLCPGLSRRCFPAAGRNRLQKMFTCRARLVPWPRPSARPSHPRKRAGNRPDAGSTPPTGGGCGGHLSAVWPPVCSPAATAACTARASTAPTLE